MACAEHPKCSLAEHEIFACRLGSGIGKRGERRARGVARLRHWIERRVAPEGVECVEPGRVLTGLERCLGFDQAGLDAGRDPDSAVATPDALEDGDEGSRAVEHRAADLARDTGVVGRREGQPVAAFVVAHRVALDARVQVPDLVLTGVR